MENEKRFFGRSRWFNCNRKINASPLNDVRCGFTLAEVLITLTIIGVIAALTIPNLSKKWHDHADVIKVKSAFSIINTALKELYRDEGLPEDWLWEGDKKEYFMNKLKPYLKYNTDCYATRKCAYFGIPYKTLNGANQYAFSRDWTPAVILNNGILVAIVGATKQELLASYAKDPYAGRLFGWIVIDINGNSAPNMLGYDVFYFAIGVNGIAMDTAWNQSNKAWVSASNCIKANSGGAIDGISCGYWVIKHGNMDYKYRDVSAEW